MCSSISKTRRKWKEKKTTKVFKASKNYFRKRHINIQQNSLLNNTNETPLQCCEKINLYIGKTRCHTSLTMKIQKHFKTNISNVNSLWEYLFCAEYWIMCLAGRTVPISGIQKNESRQSHRRQSPTMLTSTLISLVSLHKRNFIGFRIFLSVVVII